MTPRCPRCDSRDCAPCDVLLEASDESFPSTHECQKCHTRFKFSPPTRSPDVKLAAAIAVLLVAACAGKVTPPPVEQPVVTPGDGVSLLAVARQRLACDGVITFAVVEPNGGSVTPAGVYVAPECGPSFVAGTYHVEASGCDRIASIPVTVAEEALGVEIVCAEVAGTGCCAVGPLEVAPGTRILFYASTTYSCPGHVEFTPAPPPAPCSNP